MKKRIISLLTTLAMVAGLTVCLPTVAADNTIIYDASEMDTFCERSMEDVGEAYSLATHAGETYVSNDSSTYYSTPASTTYPYEPGVPTEDTLLAMQEMSNFYRWLVGVQPLQVDCSYSRSLQAQALDRNFEFAHYISDESKPDDMDDDLWAEGSVSDHNILARYYTPTSAITGWMNEGYRLSTGTWDTVGHRWAILESSLSNIQYGYSGVIAIGDCQEYKNDPMEEAFAAFPAPGYMPNNLITPTTSAWSVELNTDVVYVKNSSDVTVTITNLSDNNTYEYTSDELGNVTKKVIEFIQPDDYNAELKIYDDSYEIVISGLTDVSSGNDAEVRYTVNFFDVNEYAESYVSKYNTAFETYQIYYTMGDEESLKKIGASLDKEVQVVTDTGYTVLVPVAGEWQLDAENSRWVNTVNVSDLPSNVKDNDGVLKEIYQPYEVSSDSYDAYNDLYINPSEIYVGEDCTLSLYLVATYGHSFVYKITEDSDNSYTAVETFNSDTSEEYDQEKSTPNRAYYNLTNCNVSDAGEYISVYCYSSGKYHSSDAHVSRTIATLTVICNHNYISAVTSPGHITYTCSICGDSYDVYGDINLDGKVTTADVGLANSHAKGVKQLNDIQFVAADMNGDGKVTTADVGIINAYAKGIR